MSYIMRISHIFLCCYLLTGFHDFANSHYVNEWAVKLNCGPSEAVRLARKYGFQYVDEIFEGVHVFRHNRVARRSLDRSEEHHQLLTIDSQVDWVEQQKAKIRVKRDFFKDPDWPKQWYLNQGENKDMNVLEAYKRFGATGEGVVVTILDDGIEKNHTDLRNNYDPKASYDFNDSDDDPQPRYDFTDFNRHGTRCAGEVAAEANNDKCGVGIAYKASIGGIRMLDGDVTDALEARSISFNNDHIHIYSASWGPTDDGATLDGPGLLTLMAFEKAILKGRGGLGSIFAWASGNGGRDGDNCNCDGYAGLIYTISISSASENGLSPYYSEQCSSTLATTYSSGFANDRQIVTTDLHDLCTTTHSGTSASAPLAAGVIALALQMNPHLTWRDVQHLIVLSSKKGNLQEGDWVLNGAGRPVSHRFGFGIMDAGNLVKFAKIWKTAPNKKICKFQADFQPMYISEGNKTEIELEVDGCQGNDIGINYLEHVQSFVTVSSTNRGQTEIFLISPNGTKSNLVTERPKDISSDGFNNWAFMSTHHWGENPQGSWKLMVVCKRCSGTLRNWTLVLHGTELDPLPIANKHRILKDDEKMCAEDEFYLNDSCFKSCPAYYFPSHGFINVTSNPTGSNEILNVSMCLQCHYTCSYCSGPKMSDCISCPSDLILSADHQCLQPSQQASAYPDIYMLAAVFVAVTFAAIIISVTIAGFLTKYLNRKSMFNEYNEPLLGES